MSPMTTNLILLINNTAVYPIISLQTTFLEILSSVFLERLAWARKAIAIV